MRVGAVRQCNIRSKTPNIFALAFVFRDRVSDRRCGLLDLPPLVRAGAYVCAVTLVIAFGPGATKAFIYFNF